MKSASVFIVLFFTVYLSAQMWSEFQKVLPSDGASSEEFGRSVSISGDYAVIGAYKDNDNGFESGSAYIFYWNGSEWIEQAKLIASDGAAGDKFGMGVAISGDYVVIGAFLDDDNGTDSGSGYIFYRNGTNWTEQAKMLASDGTIDDKFGIAVDISGDYIFIGATGCDGPISTDSGATYVFKRNGTNWLEHQKLTPSEPADDGVFGKSVSISNDYAVIGGWGDDDNGVASGSAYIFINNNNTWTEQVKILPDDGATDDLFGRSVDIFGDYVVVGAYGDDDNGSVSGSAYVFIRNDTIWTQQAKLIASDGAAFDAFGWSVAIYDDFVVCGAVMNHDNGQSSGSAYVFQRTGTIWTEQVNLLSSDGAV
ncbi:MAG: FG-GAP repeat protein, partial [Candidatus Cloacimonetes bacterium]|nr:FG-GAP repeat protein [Candidatus Cloacimonadota bacterium]